MSDGLFDVRVKRIGYEADGINSYELNSPTGRDLNPFTAGGHIDVHLPNGMVRSYSLVNDQRERHRYVIAINKDPAGRGGSRFLHDNLRAGDIVRVSRPRNNFALCEHAEHSVLVAGGIGITPLLSMARRLDALGRSCELFYAARAPRAAAFLDEIEVLAAKGRLKVRLDFDNQRSGRLFDLAFVIDRAPAQAHLYCCGPQPMLEAFEAAAASRPADQVHLEYFQATEAPATAGGFEVRLARSNRTIAIEAGKTILEALLDAGIAANHACSEGICGTCETRVLEGIPDHRDQFLSKDEQASNKTMMICCSGARSGTLVLDL
ncbi:PDR/VanB family oxidoreductase [Bradyrhizobium sp. WSM3983]|uniref:PDR/VanB family oxidoreductase n=1 Tax=Bradyrhizobium sp. WSM3983 TaxID=1038867 RepID=UPI0004299465|nr:PDR/VanB family oxidoreductase [Bradyrhizobium sp. WSM3983]